MLAAWHCEKTSCRHQDNEVRQSSITGVILCVIIINCKELPISEYNHNYCHLCATMDYVLEFQYHHQRCEKEK